MRHTHEPSKKRIAPIHLPTIPPEFGPLVSRVQADLKSLTSRPTQDILALRMYTVHWAVDGLLRLVRADRNPPPKPEREAAYRAACAEFLDRIRSATLWPLLAALSDFSPTYRPGVGHLIGLLIALELFNADCRRRWKHQGVRRTLEEWQAGTREADKGLLTLTRNWKVEGRSLQSWYRPLEAPAVPRLKRERSLDAAVWHEHDTRCLEALADLEALRSLALRDIAAGDVDLLMEWNRERCVYFSTCARKSADQEARKGKGVACVPGFWADVDEDGPDIVPRLRGFTKPPDYIVSSGHGFHAYWRFGASVPPTPALKAKLKVLARVLGGDPACAEFARVMRVPFSWNRKRTPHVQARIVP
jgi:hypothetical protein